MDADTAALLTSLDAAYRADPFPSVTRWAELSASGRLPDAMGAWELARASVEEQTEGPGLAGEIEAQTRAAAWDSGAIEGLYRTDRGVTLTIARQQAHWEAVARDAGPDARSHFEAQLAGFQLVFDVATGERPLTEAFVRELHASICAPQTSYDVLTKAGVQQRELPKGTYKTDPNHALDRAGEPFAYAPVEDVAGEMQRFVDDARSEVFAAMPVDLQASWLHYALVRIHPFADGNDRVVRALASMPSWRAVSFPLVVEVDARAAYIAALAAADAGNPQVFATFVARRLIVTAEDLTVRARTAIDIRWDETDPRPGLTTQQLDDAADVLMSKLQVAANTVADEAPQPLLVEAQQSLGDVKAPSGFRAVGRRAGYQTVVLRLRRPTAIDGQPIMVLSPEPLPSDVDLVVVTRHGETLLTFTADEVATSGPRVIGALRNELARLLS